MINISTEHMILIEVFDFKHIKELNGCERIYFETLHELKNEEVIYYADCVFIVKNIEKTLVGERIIYAIEALEKFYCDMIDLFEYSETTATLNLSKACDIIFSGTGWTYTLESNLTSVAFENFGNDSKSALFQTVLKRYKREFEVDYKNKNIYIAREIGKDESVVFRYKKNIVAISETVDTKELTTYIEAEGKDGLYVKYTSVNAEKFGIRHAKKIKDERYINIEELTEYARQSIQDVPLVAFEVDALVIDEDLSLGDKVFVIHEKLGIDIHARVLAIEEMPLDRQKRKTIKLGNFVEVGFSDRVISKVEDYFDATSQADKDLQAKIDAANAAIDKEYNDRVQAVADAIAKAEADVEKAKEELNQELGQAMTDWDTAFEENKAQVDASIGNVSGILGDYIASNDEVVAGINTDLGALFDGVDANAGSIVEVSNELGTLSTKVGTVEVTANSASGTASEAKQTADSLKTTVGSWNVETDGTLSSAVSTVEQTASGLTSTVSSHTTSISGLETITKTHTSQISQTSDKISLIVSDGSTASAVQLTPNAMKFISEEINLFGNVIFNSLVDESTTEILGDKIKTGTIKTSTLLVDEEILVDGTVKAQHFVGVTAELAEITTILFKSEVLQTAWASIGQAVVGQLTADDALLNSLTAKQAFITSVQAIDFQAERVVGGYLRSTNGSYEQNLNSGETLYKTGSDVSRIKMGDFYDVRGLYMQAGVSNAGTELMLSKTGMAYFNADHISLGRSSQNAGFKFITNSYTGTTNPAANRIIPWTAGTGNFGQGSYPCYEVRVYNITDLYSVNRVSTTLSMHEAFQELNALEVVDSTQVNSYITPDQTTQKFNLEDDQPKKVRIGIDFTNLRRSRSVDSTLLFNEQNEMTLNTEIAILWKAVQELSAQINELKGA